jgi:hypothetical protein
MDAPGRFHEADAVGLVTGPWTGPLLAPLADAPYALGRRFLVDGGFQFLDDGTDLIASNNQGAFSTFLPSGLAGTINGTTWVPLLDVDGSTVALVNPASPNTPPPTTYAYDAFGNPRLSGTANQFPFLFQGLETESDFDPSGVYYLPDGEYYSSQIQRELQQVGAAGLIGPGSGLSGRSRGHSHSPRTRHMRHSIAADDGDYGNIDDYNNQSYGSDTSGAGKVLDYIPIIGPIIQEILDLFGGGSDKPPILRQMKHRAHPIYWLVLGIEHSETPDESSEAKEIPNYSFTPGSPINIGGPARLILIGDQQAPTRSPTPNPTPTTQPPWLAPLSVCQERLACAVSGGIACVFGCAPLEELPPVMLGCDVFCFERQENFCQKEYPCE